MDTLLANADAMQVRDLSLKIAGLVPEGQGLHRNVLFDELFASLPRDPEANICVYTAEIVPGGYTPPHLHNGATFFLALQGLFEAHFDDGTVMKYKAGDVYAEPIGKIHRGHNPHPSLPYLCVAFCATSPDREHVTNVASMLNDPMEKAKQG